MTRDTLSPAERSAVMRRVRSKDTKPEIRVRKALHAMGYRFRLHRKDLPGKPDVVLPKHRTAVFVHGCFWHQHPGCRKATVPQNNHDYWERKLSRNVGDRLIESATHGCHKTGGEHSSVALF